MNDQLSNLNKQHEVHVCFQSNRSHNNGSAQQHQDHHIIIILIHNKGSTHQHQHHHIISNLVLRISTAASTLLSHQLSYHNNIVQQSTSNNKKKTQHCNIISFITVSATLSLNQRRSRMISRSSTSNIQNTNNKSSQQKQSGSRTLTEDDVDESVTNFDVALPKIERH